MEKVLSLYKEIGETPLERINRFREQNPEYKKIAMTYAGRLDPMAEGLLLVLADSEVYKKEEYLGLDKIYEFEILFGLDTDTHDTLGLIICEKEIQQINFDTNIFIGKQKQRYPLYSSKTLNGIPLWKLAREGKVTEESAPQHEIEIYTLKSVSQYKISSKELLEKVLSNVSKVKGDFRQKEIKDSWSNKLKEEKVFIVLKMCAHVSSGTYIRMVAPSIGKELGTCALALSIKRLSVGDFKVQK